MVGLLTREEGKGKRREETGRKEGGRSIWRATSRESHPQNGTQLKYDEQVA